MTPLNPGCGFIRNWQRVPTKGLKSFSISHSVSKLESVMARQTRSIDAGYVHSMMRSRFILHSPQDAAQRMELLFPEGSGITREPVGNGIEALRIQTIDLVSSFAARLDNIGIAQD